jgi:hypothetical protein
MTKDNVSMPVKKYFSEGFGEVIGKIDRGVNSFEMDKISLNPFTKCKVLDVNMAGTGGWLLSVAHSRATIVVRIRYGGCFLWDVEVPEYTSDKERHTTDVACSHKFHLSAREGHSRLEFSLVCYRTAG